MTSQPILSICIPTYNRAEYLDKTLSEIVNSDIFKSSNDIEIVISNNCSTDNTNEVCLRYLEQYPDKIKYINQEKPIPWERHFIKVLEYGVGKYLKLNNDTCYFEDGMLEKIVNYLKLNNDTDFLFILNKNTKDKCLTKFLNFNDLLTYISYEITWIGSFCPQKEIFYEIKDKIEHYDSLLPQVDAYGKLFLADKTVTVWEEKLLTVQNVEKKGANYNIAEIFGNKYFEILSNYIDKNNGIKKNTIENEKQKIINFINHFYFDLNNNYTFNKSGYLCHMLKNYKYKPYFYKLYIKNALGGKVLSINKTETHREIKLFNIIKLKFRRKSAKKNKKGFITKLMDSRCYKNFCFQNSLNISNKKCLITKLIDSVRYKNFCFQNSLNIFNKKDFISYSENCFKQKNNSNDTKLIAFYLPQYHRIDINDEFHGKGFTDWKNVTAAIPQYVGHYQPHLPADCGFYDLSNPQILEDQTQIAQNYGIYGFCYHYYWFSGERLLEKPIFDMLKNKNITMPFCLCWANENWSKLWDGGNKEVIKEQKFIDGDHEKFFHDILPFFQDERYIKINNKPVLVIYRPDLFQQEVFLDFIRTQKKLAVQNGFDGIYVITSNFTFNEDLSSWELDGILEFPPHGLISNGLKVKENVILNPNFSGAVYDMKEYINNKRYIYKANYNLFKGIFPSWDNTSRKAYSNAAIFDGITPDLYKVWLKDIIKWTQEHKKQEEQFVFINAWNEWAEGAHLEADLKYGYTFLQATSEVLEETNEKITVQNF